MATSRINPRSWSGDRQFDTTRLTQYRDQTESRLSWSTNCSSSPSWPLLSVCTWWSPTKSTDKNHHKRNSFGYRLCSSYSPSSTRLNGYSPVVNTSDFSETSLSCSTSSCCRSSSDISSTGSFCHRIILRTLSMNPLFFILWECFFCLLGSSTFSSFYSCAAWWSFLPSLCLPTTLKKGQTSLKVLRKSHTVLSTSKKAVNAQSAWVFSNTTNRWSNSSATELTSTTWTA